MKQSIPCCPLTSKATDILASNYFRLFSLVKGAWSVHISVLIQTRLCFHWRKQYYYLLQLNRGLNSLNLKMSWWIYFLQTCSFSHPKRLIGGLELCGFLVDYCYIFISCLGSHSDGTHSLQRIQWWASNVMLNFSFFSIKKHILLHLGWPEDEYIFSIFFIYFLWVNYSCKNIYIIHYI